jgi:hypothetical protein
VKPNKGNEKQYQAALIANRAIAANQHVASDGLTKHFDAQHVGDHLLGLLIEVRMNQRDIVVASNAVAKSGQALLHAAQLDIVGQGISQVLQLLISSGRRHQQTVLVAGGEAADDANAGNGGVNDRNVVGKLRLVDRVKVLGTALSDQAVLVGELGKDADVVAVLELNT